MKKQLTPKELQVLQLLSDGMTQIEAAKEMKLSVETVKTYASTAKLKMNAWNTTNAVAIAMRTGFLK